MQIKIICLFILFLAWDVFSQVGVRQLTEREQEIAKIDYQLEANTVIDKFRLWDSEIRKSFKDNKPLSASKYFAFSAKTNYWVEYRWFIADTGFSRNWLKKIKELFDYMHKTQRYLYAEKFNGRVNTPEYKQADKYFKTAYERLQKLIKKPVKVSSKVKRKAKLNKVVWQKAMRKKYKIKDKPNMADF